MSQAISSLRTGLNELGIVGHLTLLTTVMFVQVVFITPYGSTIYDAAFAVLCIIWAFYIILSRDTCFFLLFFASLLSIFMVALSCVLIEGGVYIIELFETGYVTGATSRYVFYSLLLILSTYLVYAAFRNSRLQFNFAPEFQNSKAVMIPFYGGLGLIILILFGIILVYGSPLLNGMGRTKFWGTVAPPGTQYLNSLIPQLNLISGIFYTQVKRKSWRRIIVGFLVTGIAVQLLQGEKFAGLLQSIYFFLLPILFFNFRFKNAKISLSLVLKVFAVSIVALISVFVNYTLQLGDPLAGLIMIATRIGLQGQVWWAADRLVTDAGINADFFIHQIMGFGEGEAGKGLNYLMFLLAPPSVSSSYFTSGSGFTAGFPAILVLGAGYIGGAVAVLVCGCLQGFVLYLFSLVMIRKKVFFAVFALKLFFATNLAVDMGDIHLLFSFKYVLFITLSIVLYFVTIDLGSFNGKRIKI